jgi:hypothetical protein
MPKYEIENNELIYKGRFKDADPFSYYWKLKLGTSWPRRLLTDVNEWMEYSESNKELICRLLVESKKSFLNQFPTSSFLVLLHPNLPPKDKDIFTNCARHHEINYIDASIPYDSKKYDSTEVDKHPTYAFNQAIINIFIEKLRLSL